MDFNSLQKMGILERILVRAGANSQAFITWTANHQRGVAIIAHEIGEEMEMSEDFLWQLILAALIHDVGKSEIQDLIMINGELSDKQFEKVKKHPILTKKFVNGFFPENILKNAVWHHERWDGSGYPDGIKGEDIPLMTRILIMADIIRAMAEGRPYRGPLSVGLRCPKFESMFNYFDPELFDYGISFCKNPYSKTDRALKNIIKAEIVLSWVFLKQK